MKRRNERRTIRRKSPKAPSSKRSDDFELGLDDLTSNAAFRQAAEQTCKAFAVMIKATEFQLVDVTVRDFAKILPSTFLHQAMVVCLTLMISAFADVDFDHQSEIERAVRKLLKEVRPLLNLHRADGPTYP
jgi:hypothetical protein